MRHNPQPSAHSPGDVSLGRPRLLFPHCGIDTLLLALAAIWMAAILAAPILENRAIYTLFSAICHQIPARSWLLGGEPLAACIRCTSIYAGFFIALVVRLPPARRFLQISVAVMLLELTVAQLWNDLELVRAISGLLLGLAAAGFVSEGLRELISRRARYRSFPPATRTKDVLEHL